MRRAPFISVLFMLAVSQNGWALEPPPDAEVYQRVRKVLQGKGDFSQRTIRKIGNRTIEFEVFIAQEGDIKLAPMILGNFADYERWALKNINQRPGGGSYYLQIRGVSVDPHNRELLKTDSALNFPLFHKEIQRTFRMSTQLKSDVYTLKGETLPNDQSPVVNASGFMRIYPAEGSRDRVWVYVHGQTVMRQWLIYEALPERVMSTETGERMQIVLDNYMAEEDRLHLLRSPTSKSSQSPKGKTAGPDAVGASIRRK